MWRIQLKPISPDTQQPSPLKPEWQEVAITCIWISMDIAVIDKFTFQVAYTGENPPTCWYEIQFLTMRVSSEVFFSTAIFQLRCPVITCTSSADNRASVVVACSSFPSWLVRNLSESVPIRAKHFPCVFWTGFFLDANKHRAHSPRRPSTAGETLRPHHDCLRLGFVRVWWRGG